MLIAQQRGIGKKGPAQVSVRVEIFPADSRSPGCHYSLENVRNPLTSLADDVEATRRILALQDGPTVLVGHSWAGTVTSEAGVDPKVSALVYVAARAPDAGEDYGALAALLPRTTEYTGVRNDRETP
jgi:pimeloyl-ACP methyl ester carboxylesterase